MLPFRKNPWLALFRLSVAFAAIIIVLLVKPEGLFGKRQVERV